jgi:NAD-dependent dihydropyrimidine dehydrogenase PreA subunit
MKAVVDSEKCTGCGICVEACPVRVIELKQNKAVIGDDCIGCGQCEQECPNGAIRLAEN